MFDKMLDRISKLASVLMPVVIWIVGCNYTKNKDTSDNLARQVQERREVEQKKFENAQRQYANLTALLPLLTSGNASQVSVALDVYTSEASAKQAPLDLQPTIQRLTNQFPEQAQKIEAAAAAGQQQQAEQCASNPEGIYIQVANSDQQLALGKVLASKIPVKDVGLPVQGVQRINQGPNGTQIRYYSSPENDKEVGQISEALHSLGIDVVQKINLNATYLKHGCAPPRVFELWIGSSTPLQDVRAGGPEKPRG